MFCVDCGNDKEIFRDGSCFDCYLKNHEFTKGPSIFDLPHCVHCDSYKYKNLWYPESFDDILTRYIKQQFSISPELKQISFSISCDDAKIKTCSVAITGVIEGHNVTETHQLTVRMKNTVCDVCSKQFGGYHEAIIQIRSGKKKMSEETLGEIDRFIGEQLFLLQQKNKALFVTDVGQESGGIDFFLSDKQAAFTLVKKAHEQFGGNITTSSKNVGMKDGKQLYRDTYLLRFLPVEKGDVIKIDSSFMFVVKVSKNKVHVYDLKKDILLIRDASDVEKAIVLGSRELRKTMIVVSQKPDEVQVMDAKNYQMKILKKPIERIIDSETVDVLFIDDEHIYLYPYPIENQK